MQLMLLYSSTIYNNNPYLRTYTVMYLCIRLQNRRALMLCGFAMHAVYIMAAKRQIGAKMQYLFMCRSLTSAQKAASILMRSGINASVVKAPQRLASGGCGYAVSVYRRFDEAKALLLNSGLLKGKIYFRDSSGEYVEVYS